MHYAELCNRNYWADQNVSVLPSTDSNAVFMSGEKNNSPIVCWS